MDSFFCFFSDPNSDDVSKKLAETPLIFIIVIDYRLNHEHMKLRLQTNTSLYLTPDSVIGREDKDNGSTAVDLRTS